MILYEYVCSNCGGRFEAMVETIGSRDEPTKSRCKRCFAKSIERVVRAGGFSVPEGACGNAANGYSSYVGDAENFRQGRKVYK